MMKELLINLTKLNSDNMKGIMLKKLDAQVIDCRNWQIALCHMGPNPPSLFDSVV